MNSVERLDRRLRSLAKPAPLPASGPLDWGNDVLIICGGFEDRATESITRIPKSLAGQVRMCLIDYLPSSLANRTEEIHRVCSERGLAVQVFPYDRQNPAGSGKRLVDVLPHGFTRLWVDISGMSRLLVVQLIVALAQRPEGLGNITLLYAEAEEYPPTEKEVEEELAKCASDPLHPTMFLSSGVFDVTVVPELSSVAQLGQPIRLIAFPSFITHQLYALRAEIQASHFTVVHGVPPRAENAWRTDAIAQLNHVSEIPRKEEFRTSTMDYRETMDLLLDVYEQHGSMERIVVAPTGSKMQAVAVALFRAYLDDVQIVYPTPSTFLPPSEYTRGVRQLYRLDLDAFAAAR